VTTEVDRNDKDPVRKVTLVLPNSGLDQVESEYNWLKNFFAGYNITPETLSSVRALLNKFNGSDFDVLHFAAHGSFTIQAGASIPFTDGSIIPGDIPSGKFHITKPMIFLNTCNIGRQIFKFNTISGWAHKFIKEGAAIFLATLWPIDDVTARSFTEAVYENLKDGNPVGLAVKNARQTCEREGDTSHLAYVLYAHPQTKIIFDI
jgi:CHAT domain-containing protein